MRENKIMKSITKRISQGVSNGIEAIEVIYLDNTTTTTFKYLKTIKAHN